ncbi:MAG: hypothetical protein KDB27_26005 [Planctomycetales bacterium]|nr:hypothetical protein [Planctomycetales bacterium]
MVEIVPITIFVIATLIIFLAWAWLLVIGARWAKIPNVTFRRAVFVGLVVHLYMNRWQKIHE